MSALALPDCSCGPVCRECVACGDIVASVTELRIAPGDHGDQVCDDCYALASAEVNHGNLERY